MQEEKENASTTPGAPARPGTIRSVERALSLLERVWTAPGPCRLTELTRGTSLHRSSVFRLLKVLVRRGYITQDPDTRMYAPGMKLLELALRFEWRDLLFREARPRLRALADRTGETAHLALPSGDDVLLVDHVLSSHTVGVTSASGAVEPSTCTALGKALICDLDAQSLRERFGEPLRRYMPNTVTDPDRLAAELRAVRREGLAVDNEEFRAGVRCLASPIRARGGEVVAAIGISGPASRLRGGALSASRDAVRLAARQVSEAIGGPERP